MQYEIITKSDSNFFPGLKALVESLIINAANVKRTVIDCGLKEDEKKYCIHKGCTIQPADVSNFKIQERVVSNFKIQERAKYYYTNDYTNAIYAFIIAEIPQDTIVVHIDADAILLGRLDELVQKASEHGFAAIPDYPPLTLEDQIRNPDCLSDIQNIIPNLRLSSKAFNAGVFATCTRYFIEKMKPIINKLIPIHTKLWSNDQAILNLAAFHANPIEPFKECSYKFNTRPFYTRSPETPPLKLSFVNNEPKLLGLGGDTQILHFIGKNKPWHKEYNSECADFKVWQYFYSKG